MWRHLMAARNRARRDRLSAVPMMRSRGARRTDKPNGQRMPGGNSYQWFGRKDGMRSYQHQHLGFALVHMKVVLEPIEFAMAQLVLALKAAPPGSGLKLATCCRCRSSCLACRWIIFTQAGHFRLVVIRNTSQLWSCSGHV